MDTKSLYDGTSTVYVMGREMVLTMGPWTMYWLGCRCTELKVLLQLHTGVLHRGTGYFITEADGVPVRKYGWINHHRPTNELVGDTRAHSDIPIYCILDYMHTRLRPYCKSPFYYSLLHVHLMCGYLIISIQATNLERSGWRDLDGFRGMAAVPSCVLLPPLQRIRRSTISHPEFSV